MAGGVAATSRTCRPIRSARGKCRLFLLGTHTYIRITSIGPATPVLPIQHLSDSRYIGWGLPAFTTPFIRECHVTSAALAKRVFDTLDLAVPPAFTRSDRIKPAAFRRCENKRFPSAELRLK